MIQNANCQLSLMNFFTPGDKKYVKENKTPGSNGTNSESNSDGWLQELYKGV